MRRTEWLQETRQMRFEEAYGGWHARRLTQEEAARLLGVPPENRNPLISLKIPPPGVKLYERSTRPGMKQHRCSAGSLGLGPLGHQDLRGIGDQHDASSPLSVLLALDGVPSSPLPPTGGRGTAPPAGRVPENVPAAPDPARGSGPMVLPASSTPDGKTSYCSSSPEP